MYRRLYVIRLRGRSQIERIEDAAGRDNGVDLPDRYFNCYDVINGGGSRR